MRNINLQNLHLNYVKETGNARPFDGLVSYNFRNDIKKDYVDWLEEIATKCLQQTNRTK